MRRAELLKPLCGAMRKMVLICVTLAESGTKSTGSAASVAGISQRRRRKHCLVVLVAVIRTKFPLVAKEPHLAVASRVVPRDHGREQLVLFRWLWRFLGALQTKKFVMSLLQVLLKVGDTVRVVVNFYCWFLIEAESFDKFLKSLLFALYASKKWTLAFLLENKERIKPYTLKNYRLLTVISKKGASKFCLCNKIRLVFNIDTSCLVIHFAVMSYLQCNVSHLTHIPFLHVSSFYVVMFSILPSLSQFHIA